MSISGKVAVVTGGGSGIGRAIVRRLAADGARVVVADVNLESAKKVADDCVAANSQAIAIHVDIADPDSVDRLQADAEKAFGTASIVVNNAGWDVIQPFLENSRSFWRKVIDINLLGPIMVSRAFLDPMVRAGAGGRIVNIGSDAGRVGSTGETVYAGAKGGIIAFTKSLAREMARYQISVNCICPGPTDTPLFHQQSDKMKEALIRAIPFKRLGRPEEIAEAVHFFVSDGACYVTGQVLSVSGGLTMVG